MLCLHCFFVKKLNVFNSQMLNSHGLNDFPDNISSKR